MKPLFDVDYAAIEARVVCWLAGESVALDEYRAQDAATTKEEKERLDRYRIMAADIYSIPVEEVNKHPQRFIGKQAILLSGFQGGPDAFRRGCAKFGFRDMPVGLEHLAVKKFRLKHRNIVRYWYDVENAAQKAIASKGQIVKLRNIAFICDNIAGTTFLLIRLPSGRKLAYPRPRLVPSPKFEGKLAIKFFGKIGVTQHWGDVDTYGGKLVENITQAVAADVMCQGAQNAEAEGFEIMALIHDQALSYTGGGRTSMRFAECLKTMPPWADGLPIEAEGGEVPFYKKD